MAYRDAHSGEKLRRAERLGDIVVRAHVECLYLIALIAARGDDDDGQARPGAHGLYYLHAVHIRQAEVEHHEIRTVRAYHRESLVPGAGCYDIVAVCGEYSLDKAGDAFFVLYDKDPILDCHSLCLLTVK